MKRITSENFTFMVVNKLSKGLCVLKKPTPGRKVLKRVFNTTMKDLINSDVKAYLGR